MQRETIGFDGNTGLKSISIKGLKKSNSLGDAKFSVQFTINGNGITLSKNKYITVIAPENLSVISNTYTPFEYPLYGGIRLINYLVLDQFNSSLACAGTWTETVTYVAGDKNFKHEWGGGTINTLGAFSDAIGVMRSEPFPAGWFVDFDQKIYAHGSYVRHTRILFRATSIDVDEKLK